MATLLRVLTRRNLDVDNSHLKPGGNTETARGIFPDTWYPWYEFNYTNLTNIFHIQLGSNYGGPAGPEPPLPQDQVLFNEDTLEDFLLRFMVPVVNYCLDQSEGKPHFGRGSRCGGNEDWSVVSPKWLYDGAYLVNRLPGDTKISSKWWPTMANGAAGGFEWRKVMAQVLMYMASNNSRYGFIITDKVLVVLRLTRKLMGQGLAADRPRRQVATPATGQWSQLSDVSMASDDTSGQESSFQNDNPLNWEYHDPEYVVIPWSAHGGRLTVKLALWCLAMMGVNGDSYIDYSYPVLDSWRTGTNGLYIHNASGAAKKALAPTDLCAEPYQSQPERGDEAKDNVAYVSEGVADLDVVGDHVLMSSQAGRSSIGREKETAINESDEDDDEEEGGDGDDNRDEVGDRILTTVERRGYSRRLYYQNYNGNWRETHRNNWDKVEGDYIFRGRKHVYFATSFPR